MITVHHKSKNYVNLPWDPQNSSSTRSVSLRCSHGESSVLLPAVYPPNLIQTTKRPARLKAFVWNRVWRHLIKHVRFHIRLLLIQARVSGIFFTAEIIIIMHLYRTLTATGTQPSFPLHRNPIWVLNVIFKIDHQRVILPTESICSDSKVDIRYLSWLLW